jgi:hypothetical protein
MSISSEGIAATGRGFQRSLQQGPRGKSIAETPEILHLMHNPGLTPF